jgi:hypothetical protein
MHAASTALFSLAAVHMHMHMHNNNNNNNNMHVVVVVTCMCMLLYVVCHVHVCCCCVRACAVQVMGYRFYSYSAHAASEAGASIVRIPKVDYVRDIKRVVERDMSDTVRRAAPHRAIERTAHSASVAQHTHA